MTNTTTGRWHTFHHMLTGATLAMLLPLPLAAAAERATRVTDQTTAIVLQHGLLIDGVGQYGRSPVHRDVVEQALLAGTWQAPRAGATLESADGTQRTWRTIEADEHGWFSDRQHRGGYVAISIESDAPRIMLLHMMGNSMAYVNGVPRIGSRYQSKDRGDAWEPSFDYVRLPVHLREGRNDLLLMRAWRSSGRVKAELVKPAAPVILNRDDLTVPDLIVGRPVDTVGAVVLINATDSAQTDLRIKVIWQDQQESIAPVPIIQPMSVRKVAFPLVRKGTLPTEPGTRMVQLQVVRRNEGETEVLDQSQVRLQVVGQGQPYRTTFVSRIDASVQYYAVNPMYPLPAVKRAPALVLSVHGAGVEAINQARAYAAKSWCHIVAPTNRRPYGFDWEDWGRRDALEVLQHAGAALGHDPTRTYLTGHSMGGHGTWILGATLPDRFAAIAPSAGWLSFWSYRGAKKPQHPTPVEEILLRPEWASDTLVLAENLKATAVYILHGGADDNVPPTESRRMVARLKGFHKDFVYHEEPGQGHWWDLSDEPGADCVDWPALFDFLARHTLPSDNAVREIDFMTANPGINDRSHWVGVEDQEQHLKVSRVHLRVDPGQRRFVGTTDNVARLRLALDMLTGGKPLRVELDGQTIADIPWPTDAKLLWLAKRKGQWAITARPAMAVKGPHRYGPFKDAFTHQMIFVYGTRGTADENRWARNKARFDAEQWWYQGNGSVDVVADVDFAPAANPDRGVVIYGNAETNAAWPALLQSSPVQVTRQGVTIDGRTVAGDDLACLFLRPRPDSKVASVAVVSGTSRAGLQLTDRLQYLFAGCNYPDCLVIGPEMLTEGMAGVHVAGVFGSDWGVATGQFAWAADTTDAEPTSKSTEAKQLPAYIGPDPRPFVMPRGYVCQRATGPVTIDGRLDEPSWQKASWTQQHVDIEGRMRPVPPRYQTHCKMLWDDDNFYVAASLEEPHVWATITKRNDVIFNDNDFEVFIDPDGDSHDYFEFEINALNTVWNLLLDKPYKNGGTAVIREMTGQRSGVHVDGTLNNPHDTDTGWSIEIAFPWRAMAKYGQSAFPPRDGDQWRVNFSRVEWGQKIVDGRYVRVPGKDERTDDRHEDNWIWSPQGVVNMHRPETWGYVQFSKRPAGSPDQLRPDPTAKARHLLHKVLYSQEQYKLQHGRYAATLEQLGLDDLTDPSLTGPIQIQIRDGSYRATARVRAAPSEARTLQLRGDGKIWLE